MGNFCENCGKPLGANAKFCADCGSPVGAPEYLKFTCDACGKSLKIETSATRKNADGYDLNLPDGICCPCGKLHSSVSVAKPQAIVVSESNDATYSKLKQAEQSKKRSGTGNFIKLLIIQSLLLEQPSFSFQEQSASVTQSDYLQVQSIIQSLFGMR